MTQAPENSVIRVIKADGKTAGTGFLVADCMAVTCAHVIQTASCAPGDIIEVAFYCGGSNQRAEILANGYSPVEEADVAFLRLPEKQENSEPVRLYAAQNSGSHPSRCLGYPGGAEKASWSRDTINGLLTDRNPSVLQFQSNRIEHGYSGAPVYDEVLQGVVGMVNWGYDKHHTVEVHAVTADTIIKQCPQNLVLEKAPKRGDNQQKVHPIEWVALAATLLQAVPAVGYIIEVLRGFQGTAAFISIGLFFLSLCGLFGWIGFARKKNFGEIRVKAKKKKRSDIEIKDSARYPRLYRFAQVGLWVSLVTAFSVATLLYFHVLALESKTIILVTNLKGPELENYRVTDLLIEKLKEEVQGFNEIQIQTLPQSISEVEGSLVARDLGQRYHADMVLWGWYGKTAEKVQLTLHIEDLSCNCYVFPKDNTKLKMQRDVSELDNFVLQEDVGNQMSALALTVAGTTYYDLDHFDQAVPRLNKAAELFGQSSDSLQNRMPVFFYLGTSYYYLGQYQQALQSFNQALQIDPNAFMAYQNRGNVYYELGQYERVIEDCERAIQIDPNDPIPYNNRGSAYTELGQYDQAIKDFDQALSIDPNYASPYYNRGNIYFDLKQYERAIQDYSQALLLNPLDYEAYTHRGRAYSNLRQYESAIRDFDQALLIDPTYTLAYINRGIAYLYIKQYERGIQDFDQAIQIDPNSDAAYDNRGNAYDELGQHERAIQDYNQALQLNPESAAAYYNRAIAYQKLGLKEKAAEDLRMYYKLSQDAEQNPNNLSQP